MAIPSPRPLALRPWLLAGVVGALLTAALDTILLRAALPTIDLGAELEAIATARVPKPVEHVDPGEPQQAEIGAPGWSGLGVRAAPR